MLNLLRIEYTTISGVNGHEPCNLENLDELLWEYECQDTLINLQQHCHEHYFQLF